MSAKLAGAVVGDEPGAAAIGIDGLESDARPEANELLANIRSALPDLEKLAKKPALIEWKAFPSMQPNPDFVAALSGALSDKEAPLLFICRSGARSAAAAKAMTAAGYSTCFNVADGFEGPLDAQGKRGSAGGWKATGLPWRQT